MVLGGRRLTQSQRGALVVSVSAWQGKEKCLAHLNAVLEGQTGPSPPPLSVVTLLFFTITFTISIPSPTHQPTNHPAFPNRMT